MFNTKFLCISDLEYKFHVFPRHPGRLMASTPCLMRLLLCLNRNPCNLKVSILHIVGQVVINLVSCFWVVVFIVTHSIVSVKFIVAMTECTVIEQICTKFNRHVSICSICCFFTSERLTNVQSWRKHSWPQAPKTAVKCTKSREISDLSRWTNKQTPRFTEPPRTHINHRIPRNYHLASRPTLM